MSEQQDHSFMWLIGRLPSDRPLRVLDVGCGECLEGETLLSTGVDLVGIDFDEKAIATTCARLPRAKFICADAAALDSDWTSPFDVVLFRRPDIAAQPARWRGILALAPGWLTPGGRVLLTTPGPQEADWGRQWLKESGFKDTRLEQLDTEDERLLVTATQPDVRKSAQVPAMPINVIRWDEEDNDPALFCDPRTGMCSPAPINTDSLLEEEHVNES